MVQTSVKRDWLIDAVWLLLLVVLTGWCCTATSSRLSATFDEPTYLQVGLEHWHTGSYKQLMRLGTMPLPIDVQTLPLYLWEKSHGRMIDVNRDIDWILAWARMGNLLFWAVLLFYTLRIGRSLAGPWAGRLAATLVACEPVLLGHAALATTDIALTALMMVFVFEFQAGQGKGWWRQTGIPAIIYGLAITAKASALVFAPLFMLVIIARRVCTSDEFTKIPAQAWKERLAYFVRRMWEFKGRFFAIIGIALLVTFLYVRSDWTVEPTFVKWARGAEPGTKDAAKYPGLPPGKFRDTMVWTSEHLKIFTNAGEGLAQQIKHNFRGHASWFMGREMQKKSVPYYFAATLLIKGSIPFLLLPLLALAVGRRAFWNWPMLCALALLVYSFTCKVQIGIRFMFPLMTLAMAGTAVALVLGWRGMVPGWKRSGVIALILLAIGGNTVSALAVMPQGICYTNPFWGGTPSGYRYLSDSNYDWGQGLKELIAWRNENHVDTIDVWYFGLDPRNNEAPLRVLPLNDADFTGGKTWEELFRGKVVAVSTTMLYGSYHDGRGLEAVDFLKRQTPAGRTTTYFIYDFRDSPTR